MISPQVEESIHDFGDKICAFEEVLSMALTGSDAVTLHDKAIKDKEQAVHFGARRYSQQCMNLSSASSPRVTSFWSSSSRCLSCNRTFDDVVKTPGDPSDPCSLQLVVWSFFAEPPGTVNLPAEKRRAQAVVFRGVGRIAMRRAFISESQGLALPDQVRLRDIVTGLAHPSCSQAFCVVGGCHRAYLISVPS